MHMLVFLTLAPILDFTKNDDLDYEPRFED